MSHRGKPQADEAAPYFFRYIDRVAGGDVLTALAAQLENPLAGWREVSEAQSRFRPAADAWSARQVLGHLSDAERVFAGRALWFARGFASALPSYDADPCAQQSGADDVPWSAHLDEFEAVRRSTLALLRNLPDAAWDRRGVASDMPFSVRALAYIIAGHTEHHAALLRERYLLRAPGAASAGTREEELLRLNEAYVRASLAGDVEWYREHLAEDFVCIDSDGSVLDKGAFLALTARGSDLAEYRLAEVGVRFHGDVALVRASGAWTSKTGRPGRSLYVDVYVRAGEAWKAVSAQITRPADA